MSTRALETCTEQVACISHPKHEYAMSIETTLTQQIRITLLALADQSSLFVFAMYQHCRTGAKIIHVFYKTQMYIHAQPVKLPRRTQLTSASPSPLQECQSVILFLLPQKTKVTSSGQTLDSCTFCMLLRLFGCKVLLSPKGTCFMVDIIVSNRTKKFVLFNARFCCRGLTYFKTVKQSSRTFY